MRLAVEVEGVSNIGTLPGEGATLVAFMSFAAVRGFGARHPLIALADLLSNVGVRLGPLTTFYEQQPDDAEDEANLERAWQDAVPLAKSLEGIIVALDSDERTGTFVRRADAEGLRDEAVALRKIVESAARAKRRIRLTYEL